MKWINKIRPRIEGIVNSIGRFPLTAFFLLGITLMDAWMIERDVRNLEFWVAAFVIGALLSVLAQIIYERFMVSSAYRYGLYAVTVAATIGYYFLVKSFGPSYLPLNVRSGIFGTLVLIAVVWVPSIKSKIYFHESFLAGLKSYFLSGLYSIVIAIGTSALLFAISHLLVEVPFNTYLHMWNINFALLAPLFLLSFIPHYPGRQEETKPEEVRTAHAEETFRAVSAPKSLEILLTYIVIPLLAICTVVLLLYFVTNLRQNFWSDPVLEPLILSYALTGLFIFLLVCTIDNKTAAWFKRIFPKLIVVLMAFQLFASFMRMREIGLTHGRYFVLLTVAATLVAGVLFSFLPAKKSGWLAVILLAAGFIAMTPPVDGFTIGRRYHINLLEKTLEQNDMLEDGRIQSGADIPRSEKVKIVHSVSYLESIGGLQKVAAVGKPVLSGRAFEELFGFSDFIPREDTGGEVPDDYGINYPDSQPEYADFYWKDGFEMNVSDFDYIRELSQYSETDDLLPGDNATFEVDGREYTIATAEEEEKILFLELQDPAGETLQTVDLIKAYQEILERGAQTTDGLLTLEDATIIQENDQAKLQLIFTSVRYSQGQYSADFYLLVQIKK